MFFILSKITFSASENVPSCSHRTVKYVDFFAADILFEQFVPGFPTVIQIEKCLKKKKMNYKWRYIGFIFSECAI